ncbi:unnamed protein product, partial [Allacma fusca]
VKLQQQRGRRFVQNRIHRVNEHCQLLVPKLLNLDEYKWLISQPVPFHAASVSNNHAVMFSLPPEVEMAERKYFDLDKIQDQCVAKYVQQCSYKPLRQGGVFRKEEKKIQPIGLVSEYHQGELTGPHYYPEDICQNGSDVVKIVNDLVELCADNSCQYINDFDLSAPMHLDDYGLSTTSFNVAGATKVWISIAPKDKLRFQKLVEVKYLIVLQNPGDLLLLAGNTYHQVHNPGFNIVRGINHNDDREHVFPIESIG